MTTTVSTTFASLTGSAQLVDLDQNFTELCGAIDGVIANVATNTSNIATLTTTVSGLNTSVNTGSLVVRTAKTPASATDTGTTGQIAWDANYIYVCVNTNTWKRAPLTTW